LGLFIFKLEVRTGQTNRQTGKAHNAAYYDSRTTIAIRISIRYNMHTDMLLLLV